MRFFFILTLCTLSFGLYANDHGGIWVDGHGQTDVKPDIVSINLVVSTLDASASKAQQDNAKIANDILTEIKNYGVAGKDIQTSSFNLSPEYDYKNGKRTLKGHRVQHSFTILLRQITKLGDFLDDITKKSNDSVAINNISFDIANKEQLKIKALEAAISNARKKAEAMAKASQKKLGAVIAVEELGASFGAPRPMLRMETMAKAASTPVESGEVSVEAQVKIHFDLN